VVDLLEETEDESTPMPIKPIQPMIDAEALAPYIDKVYPRPCSEWSEEFIEELGALMANRGGFNCSNKTAIAASGAGRHLDWFLAQYVTLYETNKHFEDLIDPWYVICEGIPQTQDQLYVDAVNAANRHVGGRSIANLRGEPIQFSHGRNWFLHCQDREQAMRVASFLHGRLQWADFHTSVIDSRYLAYA
jgi:hypothetical protein